MKKIAVLLFLLVLLPVVLADCVDLNNPDTYGTKINPWSPTRLEVRYNTTLCPGTYNVRDGLVVANLFVTLDCNGATLVGNGSSIGVYVGRGGTTDYSYQPYITVKNCNIQNYNKGIVVSNAYYTTIEGNNIIDTKGTGMLFTAIKYSTIRNNRIISGSYNGMTFERNPSGWRTEENEISGNVIEGFTKKGIELNQVDNNTFIGNIIRGNGEYGIYSFNSNNNLIYDNLFENDHNSYSSGSSNLWSIEGSPGTNIIGGSQLGGNFWSDYTGADADNDGFGDIPYAIGSSSDSLPLFLHPCPDAVVCPDGSCVDALENCSQESATDGQNASFHLQNMTEGFKTDLKANESLQEKDASEVRDLARDLLDALMNILKWLLGEK